MGEWQPIETAPFGTEVLVWTDTGCHIAYQSRLDGWSTCGIVLTDDMGGLPLYWQLLPEPPK